MDCNTESSFIYDTLVSIEIKYNHGQLNELKTESEKLLKLINHYVISDNLKNTLTTSFYTSLINIIIAEIKIIENLSNIQLEILISLLKCLRSSFYQSPSQQMQISSDEYIKKSLYSSYEELLLFIVNRETLCNKRIQDALIIYITCFVNMVSGNSYARKNLWPTFLPNIKSILSHSIAEVNHTNAAILHQFLLEPDIKKEILSLYPTLFVDLLQVYSNEGENSIFTLLCMKILLEEPLTASLWDSLTADVHLLLLLDILSSCIEKKTIPLKTAEYMTGLYKNVADDILNNKTKKTCSLDPKVFHRLVSSICCLASSEDFRETTQQDKSLLISTIYLLKSLKVTESTKRSFTLEDKPVDGFKRDLIRLVACLVYHNEQNQNCVCEIGGISLLLESSQIDDSNPLIRETCIFALRNLLENNLNNQKFVANLQAKEIIPNDQLEKMGLQASILDGKVIVQSNKK